MKNSQIDVCEFLHVFFNPYRECFYDNFRANTVPSSCQVEIIIHFKRFEEMALYQRFEQIY